MAGITTEIIERGLDEAMMSMAQLVDMDRFELMDTVGRLVQNQTRQRIVVEKKSPDGTPWQANSEGTATLYASGALHDSIDYQSDLDSAQIGSALVYAAIHHFGGVIKPKNAKRLAFMMGNRKVFAKQVTMPARPYLGLSQDNIEEVESVVGDFINEVLQ